MATKGREELILHLDWDILDACNGFTFDMGGSVMKVAFIDKMDWVEPSKRKQGSQGCLRLVNFSRKDLEEGFLMVKERAHMKRNSDSETLDIYSTGYGGTQYAKTMTELFNVKNMQLMEMDCFNEAFKYLLKNLPRSEVEHPVYEPAFKDVIKTINMWENMMENYTGKSEIMDAMVDQSMKQARVDPFKQLDQLNKDKPFTDDEDIYPCCIVMCGSAIGFSMINKSGVNNMLHISPRGGKMFLGLASLFTGAKSFEEMMELCEKGKVEAVSETQKSIFQQTNSDDSHDTGDKDVYKDFAEMVNADGAPDDVGFFFGHANGKKIEDFSKEDLARSLLEFIISDLVNMAVLTAIISKARHVFFCGGFVNNQLVRECLTRAWLMRCAESMFSSIWNGEIQLHFMVHGQSLGAIGAMLNHKTKWSEKSNVGSSNEESNAQGVNEGVEKLTIK